MRALILFAAFITSLIFAMSCSDGDLVSPSPDCESCPDQYMVVSHCPAFASCLEVESCDETIVCAPDDEENNQLDIDAGHDYCDAAVAECPAGSIEVSECPDGYLCTRIPFCDASILCLELQDACALEPLCPDDDRGVEDYGCDQHDETCYRNIHCSGPITCLRCDLLPEDCPEDTVPIDHEECDEEARPCERVDTCEETLYCAPPACEDPTCPEETVSIESCDPEDENCFAIDACEDQLYCGAPEHESDCRAIPTCPDDYKEVSLSECQTEPDECVFKVACGKVAGCLPDAY